MQADALTLASPACARNRDVDWAVSVRQQGPQLRGAAVAERRILSIGEHRRHPPPLVAQPGVAQRVYAAVDPMQAAGMHSMRNGPTSDASGNELAEGHHSVLSSCEPRDRLIANGAFRTHTVRKAPRALVCPLYLPVSRPRRRHPVPMILR